jgi:hypothetical protein
LEETIFVDAKMEQSTLLPPRSAPAEDPQRMTDEKLIKEIFDRQTRNLERTKFQTQNASSPQSERPKGVQEELSCSMADKFDYQITSQHNSTIAPSEKIIFAEIKSTIDDIYSRPEDRPSLTVGNVRNQVEQKLGLEEGFFVQDAGKEKWKNLIKSYAVSTKPFFHPRQLTSLTFR